MELPSTRELELEVLLRQRETQLAELKDEAISLRRYLAKQPGPSKTELVSLSPAVLAVLMPHIESQANHTASSVSATVAGGMNQRMRQLQEENDELYNLLKSTETGKLKDEVRSLRRAVAKLEGALKESHQIISSLSEELEKTHEVLMSTSRHKDLVQPYPRAYSDSPRSSYRPELSSTNSKLPPTGPRAHKRPRLLEHTTPPARPMVPLPPKPQTQAPNHSHHAPSQPHQNHQPPLGAMRDQSRQPSSVQDKDTARHNKANTNNTDASDPPHHRDAKMELDPPGPGSPATVRERDRAREREKNNKERERRDRESRDISGNATSGALPSKPPPPNTAGRRNGSNYSNPSGRSGGGGGGGAAAPAVVSARKVTNTNNNPPGRSHSQSSDNRTLQQRMGL